ncbi:tiny tim 50 [Arctopsyche grandis]|uniref:tiny tim 50 n=1 Tax=Arctopsyche grandis TaxID=121162 RepID=UPI00406D79C5
MWGRLSALVRVAEPRALRVTASRGAQRLLLTARPVLCPLHFKYFSSNVSGPSQTKTVQATQGSNLLGQLFPQTTLNNDNTEELQKQQEDIKKESDEKTQEHEKSWRRMKFGFVMFSLSMTAAGVVLVCEMGAPRLDENGKEIEDEFSNMPTTQQYLRRMWRELTFYEKMIKEPSREKLLPDPAPYPYQQPYTLILEFKDVLVHPDWSYQTGWRFKKRPGLDSFLEALSSTAYEIVIFTTENPLMIWPIIEQLDPNSTKITYRLFRDSTHFIDGVHVKNLDNLNRDLSKVIAIDWNPQSTKLHPQNTLKLPRWNGNDDDTTLLDLTALLKTIAVTNVDDVREVLSYYSQFEDPIAAFRENQRRLVEQMEEREKLARAVQQPVTSKWTRSFLRN